MTKNRLSFTGLQNPLMSENELNSMGNFSSTETVRDAHRLWGGATSRTMEEQ